MIDLRTGELRPGRADDRLTRRLDLDYDPDAQCPRWERFLSEVFPNDDALPGYVRRLVGYGITGSTREQCFAVFHGNGSNGKSTLLNTLEHVFATYTARTSFDVFTGDRRGGPEVEALRGARLALASETNRTSVLNTAAIKEATGGERLVVNPKYRAPYSFRPECLIVLATNYRPVIKDADHGTWRRVRLVPFEARFEGTAKDPQLEDTLRGEAVGILRWAVDGAREWFEHGLGETSSMVAAVDEYRQYSDPLDGFLGSVVEIDGESFTANGALLEAYRQWAEPLGEVTFNTAKALASALMERDERVTRERTRTARGVRGVRVLTSAERDRLDAGLSAVPDAPAAERDVFGQERTGT